MKWKQAGYSKQFYYDQNIKYPSLSRTYISGAQALKIAKELNEVFNLRINKIRLSKKIKRSWFKYFRQRQDKPIEIIFSDCEYLNLLTVLHEVAHAYEFRRHGKSRHGKRLAVIIQKLVYYADSKNYWGLRSL